MGIATSYWLARAGADTLVIERHGLGGGASGRNAGIITLGPIDEYWTAIRKAGRAAARELTAATIENRSLLAYVLTTEGIEAGYRTDGFLSLACSESELRILDRSSDLLRIDGFEAVSLSRRECEDRIGTRLGDRFLGGAWSPGDGGLDPEAYLQGLAEAARRHGVRFLAGTAVLRLRRAGRLWRVETAQGAIEAEQVVLATNEETPRFLPELQKSFRTLRSQVVLTEPAAARVSVSWAANGASEYGRQSAGGGLVIGGLEPRRRISPAVPEPGLDLRSTAQRLRRYLRRSFPELAALQVVRSWSGVMAMAGDHLPLAGPWPGAPGLWLITGFGGQGLSFSQAIPAALAQALATGSTVRLPACGAPARFGNHGAGRRGRPLPGGGRRALEARF